MSEAASILQSRGSPVMLGLKENWRQFALLNLVNALVGGMGWDGLFAVRPPDEFALGYLPGAVNIPLRELEERLAELDPAQEIVSYCRGAY